MIDMQLFIGRTVHSSASPSALRPLLPIRDSFGKADWPSGCRWKGSRGNMCRTMNEITIPSFKDAFWCVHTYDGVHFPSRNLLGNAKEPK